ncbi:hypothetical protein M9H77_02553 [Catharanthus roseus]|uniref:Uncharacterized protein n=1 Tax=Catharanthus roseus TaxID=4058 RepID=A0ACC0C983_CATRO|nr:hypothetical protein M9H77_02553 [Catharanthus roseus]
MCFGVMTAEKNTFFEIHRPQVFDRFPHQTFIKLSALIDVLAWDCCSWFELAKRFGTRNGYNDTSHKRIPRNDARNQAWEQKVESLFYSYRIREEKFQLVLKFLSYELNVWWDCKYENRRRIGAQPIKTWSLMKQSLRNKFLVENHERQRQGQAKEKFIESSG